MARSVAESFRRSWIRLIRPGLSETGVSVRIVQLRYAFRLDPTPGQRIALARAFGCARVVYNDAITARERARAAGQTFPTAAVLSRTLVTEAKKTPERHWLGEVSTVVLQQSLRDAEAAYRNFFASLKGARNGARVGAPRRKSRKDNRQSVRFTANARWKLTQAGRLLLPKIGEVKVRWSRTLPTIPSSVTVIKDAAGRSFASFVIDTDPEQDRARFSDPDPDSALGIDLGLTHFSFFSARRRNRGESIFLPSERIAQRELSRKQKGSKNRGPKARLKVARAHDETGLLVPGERSHAGHRRYGEADLDRLQQILFYRELGFPLDEVAVLLDDPAADPRTHLRRQHELSIPITHGFVPVDAQCIPETPLEPGADPLR